MATPFDPHANFAYSTVLTAPSPAASGTSLVVQAGDGAKFPTVSFNAVVWPVGAQPTTANAEIVRVTTVATDTFTITRTQESSNARTIVVGDQIATNVTAKYLTDIESLAAAQSTITTAGTQTALAIPAGYGPLIILCNNATTLTIQGIAIGLAGQRLTLISIGAGNVVLQHQNGGATAANRLVNNQAADQTLVAGSMSASYTYDTTANRWRQDVMSGQLPASGTSGGILGYTGANTIASSVALAAGAVVVGGGAGATPTGVAAVAAGATLVSGGAVTAPKYTTSLTNGQVLIGSTGADAVPATITAGTGITITNGAGAITLAAPSLAILAVTNFETLARFTNSSSTLGANGLTQDTTGGQALFAKTTWTILPGATQDLSAGNPLFSIVVSPYNIGSDVQTFWGIGDPTVTGAGGYTYTNKHIGFKLVRAASGAINLFGTQADGTTEAATAALTTVANTDQLELIASVTSSTSVDYYWRKNGGALSAKTTVSTNLPNTVAGSMHFGVSNVNVATQDSFYISAASYKR